MEDNETMHAPVAAKKDSVLSIHNDERTDPYFWMRLTDEQKNADNPDDQTQMVRDYLNAENDYTRFRLKHTEKLQDDLFKEITGRIKQTDETVPFFKNGYWYYRRYEEGKEYPIHCRKKGSLEDREEVLLDVNELAEGHTYYELGDFYVSPDNSLLAFSEDTVSRRIYTFRFKDLNSGEFLNDLLINAESEGSWANDNKTFFYTTQNEVSLLSEKMWRHELGTDPSEDVLIYEEKDPAYFIGIAKSKSDEYLIIQSISKISNDYFILDANDARGEFREFTPREPEHEYSIFHLEDKFYILTNWNAENFRLMETSENATEKSNWKEVIPHRKDVLLSDIEVFKEFMVITERYDASTHLRVINQKNDDEHYLDFGEPAYVAYTSVNPETDTDMLRFYFSSMKTPGSIFDYNMRTREKELKKQQEIVGGHEPDDYVTERLFATARDGIRVPISLVHKKGIQKNSSAPLLLYGYGSYGSSEDPWFSSTRLSLLDRGFIYAIAHVRGGQEMGRQWYENGKMLHKKNTFNDFIDCAQYLIGEGYTTSDHLYAYGGSAGGMLIGVVINEKPDLFNGAIAEVPFVDVVNTMLDETIPLTTIEFDEWGNPKDKKYYDYIKSYSPYDQLKQQDYPNLLVTTGFFDSQVQYWEPAKWVARLRDYKTDDNLLLLHTNMEVGHGGASGRFKRYKDTALVYAFLLLLENKLE